MFIFDLPLNQIDEIIINLPQSYKGRYFKYASNIGSEYTVVEGVKFYYIITCFQYDYCSFIWTYDTAIFEQIYPSSIRVSNI